MESPNLFLIMQGVFWLFVIFVGLRWTLLWYFKINQRVRLQEESVALLRSINERLGGDAVVVAERKAPLSTIPASVRALRDQLAGRGKRFPQDSAANS